MNGNGVPGRSTLIITNAIKLAGLVITIYETFASSGQPSPVVLLIAAFMMSGAQLSERLLLNLARSFFTQEEQRPPKESQRPPP